MLVLVQKTGRDATLTTSPLSFVVASSAGFVKRAEVVIIGTNFGKQVYVYNGERTLLF
jgi:hypothetical protein